MTKMSIINDNERFFRIEADEYENRKLSGTVYHGQDTRGISFFGLLELTQIINHSLDEMGCPRQTVRLRQFTGRRELLSKKRGVKQYRKGTLASFLIAVKYRQNASWQGELIWEEEREEYGSYLELTGMIDRLLTKESKGQQKERRVNACQIAVDSCRHCVLSGAVQNVTLNQTEEFEGAAGLALAMERILGYWTSDEKEIKKRRSKKPETDKLVSAKIWNIYRKGGSRATFVVKVLFRENASWQGIVYWRERGENQRFRSFMELALMIASAADEAGKNEFHQPGADKEYLIQG